MRKRKREPLHKTKNEFDEEQASIFGYKIGTMRRIRRYIEQGYSNFDISWTVHKKAYVIWKIRQAWNEYVSERLNHLYGNNPTGPAYDDDLPF